jgi:uncharacterized membrane protein
MNRYIYCMGIVYSVGVIYYFPSLLFSIYERSFCYFLSSMFYLSHDFLLYLFYIFLFRLLIHNCFSTSSRSLFSIFFFSPIFSSYTSFLVLSSFTCSALLLPIYSFTTFTTVYSRSFYTFFDLSFCTSTSAMSDLALMIVNDTARAASQVKYTR